MGLVYLEEADLLVMLIFTGGWTIGEAGRFLGVSLRGRLRLAGSSAHRNEGGTLGTFGRSEHSNCAQPLNVSNKEVKQIYSGTTDIVFSYRAAIE